MSLSEPAEKLEPSAGREALRAVNPHFRPIPMREQSTVVRRRHLPFYSSAIGFYEFTDVSTLPPVTKYALHGAGLTLVMDWAEATLNRANQAAGLKLSNANVLDYVRFFLNFVAGQRGAITPIESMDQLRLPPNLNQARKALIQKAIKPLVHEMTIGDVFRVSGSFLFNNALIGATLAVQADGRIGFQDQSILNDDLPLEGPPRIL